METNDNMEMDISHTIHPSISREASVETEIDLSMQDDQDNGESSEKRRGPTILADVWNQSPDEKWVVKFNHYGQSIGDAAGLLASFIGTIGRNPELSPQGFSDWRQVPKEYKDKCMDEIKLIIFLSCSVIFCASHFHAMAKPSF